MVFKTTESIDTNILLRLILNDIPTQRQKALALLNRNDISFNVSDLAISEAVYVLTSGYHLSRDFTIDALHTVLSRSSIRYNQALFETVAPFYLSHPALSFNDCCLATYAAIDQSEPLWTFDQKLATQSPTAKLLN